MTSYRSSEIIVCKIRQTKPLLTGHILVVSRDESFPIVFPPVKNEKKKQQPSLASFWKGDDRKESQMSREA